ncbi:MAG: c-type cytochrome, partial [Akkermansiaceae bacterium]
MSDPSTNKPDLDENSSVLVDASAVSRENHMLTEGAEPISLWVILASAVVVLIGGGVLFGSSLFDYKNFVKEGYVRKGPPNAGDGKAAPKPAKAAYVKEGKAAYSQCAGCHQNGGEGNATYPPLAASEWVTGESLRPAMIILNG